MPLIVNSSADIQRISSGRSICTNAICTSTNISCIHLYIYHVKKTFCAIYIWHDERNSKRIFSASFGQKIYSNFIPVGIFFYIIGNQVILTPCCKYNTISCWSRLWIIKIGSKNKPNICITIHASYLYKYTLSNDAFKSMPSSWCYLAFLFFFISYIWTKP